MPPCSVPPNIPGHVSLPLQNREDQNLPLNDGTQKIILNTKGIFDDVRPELKRLLNFIDGRQPEDSFYTRSLQGCGICQAQ